MFEECYCAQNERVALEPVLMMGVTLLQFLDGVPDRQAVEMLHYHVGADEPNRVSLGRQQES